MIRRSALLLAASLLSLATIRFGAEGPRRNFVNCPIVRDTASVPCWLAEDYGELNFLTIQSDVAGHAAVAIACWSKAPCPPSLASAAASS